MPCNLCNEKFNIMPCKFKEQDLFDRVFTPVVKPGHSAFHGIVFNIRWNLLNRKCPCTECLIKMMCNELCDIYSNDICVLAEKLRWKPENENTKTS